MHKKETFSGDAPFDRSYPVSASKACQTGRLALLSQGYVFEASSSNPFSLKASKSFQPDEDIHVVLEFHLVCVGTESQATVYANAVETQYELKKSRGAAGFSVSSVGSINLPWGSSSEELVKVAGKTVTDKTFYERFFGLIEQQLGLSPAER